MKPGGVIALSDVVNDSMPYEKQISFFLNTWIGIYLKYGSTIHGCKLWFSL